MATPTGDAVAKAILLQSTLDLPARAMVLQRNNLMAYAVAAIVRRRVLHHQGTPCSGTGHTQLNPSSEAMIQWKEMPRKPSARRLL